MPSDDLELRKRLVEACHILDREGLVHGYGHVSTRAPDRQTVLISPRLALRLVKGPEEILRISMGGTVYKVPAKGGKAGGKVKTVAPKLQAPLELFAHTEVYRIRPDVNAICRFHGKFSLVMSVLRKPLRPVHELALALGREIQVFDSPELIGTPEIGHRMAQSLGAARSLLMQGNGQLTVGASVEEAVVNAIMLETSAEVQWRALCIGEPVWIEGDEYARLAKRDYEWVKRPWDYYLSRSKSR
ncbi:MAG: class II aldolase/adducin family protein [Acidobacteria bacterium]|nr:class II aldolase/adducin family protein [Acidobacteriota bacterium]